MLFIFQQRPASFKLSILNLSFFAILVDYLSNEVDFVGEDFVGVRAGSGTGV